MFVAIHVPTKFQKILLLLILIDRPGLNRKNLKKWNRVITFCLFVLKEIILLLTYQVPFLQILLPFER